MTDTGFVIVRYSEPPGIRTRRLCPQGIRVRLSDPAALVVEVIRAVPCDADSAAPIDQIIAPVRARRPHDRTNSERQRRFRQPNTAAQRRRQR
jgi:hypothetical protein